MYNKKLFLFGAQVHQGQPNDGTDLAPQHLRTEGLKELMSNKFQQLIDCGNYFGTSPKEVKALEQFAHHFSQALYHSLSGNQHMGLVIGGDHSCAIGTLWGALRLNPDMKVIWVDAHADMNTLESSPSGNLHGMPLAFFLGLENKIFTNTPTLHPHQVVHIGLRDVDNAEKRFLKELDILHFSANDVHRFGINQVLQKCQKHLDPNHNSEFYLSFDTDALDPSLTPATGTPVANGLNIEQAQEIMNYFSSTGRLKILELVEFNPELGQTQEVERTVNSLMQVLSAVQSQYPASFPLQNPSQHIQLSH